MTARPASPQRPRKRTPVKPEGATTTGRPDMLTQDRQDALLRVIRAGTPLSAAADYAGITRETVRKWRRRGEKALELPAGRRSPLERRFAVFVAELDKALAETTVHAQATVRSLMIVPLDADAATRRTALEASKFYLTHRASRDYSTQTRTEVTGADGGALRVDMTGDEVFDIIAGFIGNTGEDDGD